jgi:hypothetical protein
LSDAPARHLDVVAMSDVTATHVDYLVDPQIPIGKLTLLEGDPSSGKTYCALSIAAAVTTGKAPFPSILVDGEAEGRTPQNVLYISVEDDIADTLKPRFLKLGGDTDRFFAVKGVIQPHSEGPAKHSAFDFSDMALLDATLRELRIRFLVIDPIQGFLGAKVDMNRANEVRPLLAALSELAAKHSCAPLLIRHLNKASQGKSMYRGMGSIDFTAAARSVLLAGRHPTLPDSYVMVHTKCSVGPRAHSMRYEIDDLGLHWKGEVHLSADDILQPAAGPRSLESAKSFFQEILRDGPKSSEEVSKLATKSGLSARTLDRGKKELGVVSRPSGFRGPWTYQLPDTPLIFTPADVCQSQGLADCGSLESEKEEKTLTVVKKEVVE